MNNKVWNKLLEFETRDLLDRFITEKHKRSSSARQVLEISSNFIQGREYFKNANQAAFTVKPLLLYYGVTALTRGLILAISPHLSESNLKPAHGLDTLNWRDDLAKKDFGNLTATIREGTFYELLSATSNKSYLKHNSSGVNWSISYDIPALNQPIKLIDLIQTFPDFREGFEIWTQKKLHYAIVQSWKAADEDKREFIFENPWKNDISITEEFCKQIFGVFEIKQNIGNKTTVLTSDNSTPQFSQSSFDAFNAGIGDIAITKPINDHLQLNSLSQYYALSFFLGMLSRYFPSVWISLGRTEKGDAIYPLLTKIIDAIETQYPQLILEFLNGPYKHELAEG